MLDVVDQVCTEHRRKFKKRTVARLIETTDNDLKPQPKRLVPSFQLFCLRLDNSHDIDDTGQLVIFLRRSSEKLETTEEFLTMESMKGITNREHIFECVKNAYHILE
ncbi:hypothetical protein RF11_14300 [Thelohanellus kitauei]|uniref:Uncharacterized protein n=1 Tax=Thelohanellus kitauei TaxID=669202 RepID=A0A0C2N113_THEKT|nr:hypothetical protein RF11_14300 [Thelohanellus kitauei]